MEKKLTQNNRSFDDNIKSKLLDYEVTPSPHIWGKIESELHPIDSKPKGIFWLQNKMMLSAIGILLLVGFSSAGAKYVIKNILKEYQVEKAIANHSPVSNIEFISNINKNNTLSKDHTSKVLTSASNSTIDKVSNYLEEVNEVVTTQLEGKKQSKASTQSVSSNNQSVLNRTPIENNLGTPKIASSPFTMMTMNLKELENMSNVSTLSGGLLAEEVIFNSNAYNLKGFYVGPDAGASIQLAIKNHQTANPIIGNRINYLPTVSAKMAIVLGYNINNRIGIESKMSYLRQSQKFESLKYDAKANGTLKLTYLEIPLNVRYKFNQMSKNAQHISSINVSAGLQYAYLAQAKLSMKTKITKQNTKSKTDMHDYLSNHRLGVDAGVDYDIFLSKNLYWTVGVDGSIMGDVANTNIRTSPTVAIGIHTGIRFFSGGVSKGKH